MTWQFQQQFGNDNHVLDSPSGFADADVVNTLQFDHSGDCLAAGDRGGRIVILKRKHHSSSSAADKSRRSKIVEYKVHTEFQGHEPAFDYLKSVEIDEKVNCIQFFRPLGPFNLLLSANERNINMWRISEESVKTSESPVESTRENKLPSLNLKRNNNKHTRGLSPLKIPKLRSTGKTRVSHSLRKSFAASHAFSINSLSISSDQETFLSADDLRINIWNVNDAASTHVAIDIKPENMENLKEVITSASFHPEKDYLFVYTSSKGITSLCDIRCASRNMERHALHFKKEQSASEKTFFTEIVSSVSDAKLTRHSNLIVSRDYMNLRIWDIRNQKAPVKTFPVHESLRSKLCDLYEDDHIFDKFQVHLSPQSDFALTGSYGKRFHIVDLFGDNDHSGTARQQTKVRRKKAARGVRKKSGSQSELRFDEEDLHQKIIASVWHPTSDIIAMANVNNLCIFKQSDKKKRMSRDLSYAR
mmetsp:Transcript_10412/g.38655  ORF Transcript_10412/g.38655 Transcript_10412/m.38655 type:complete len:474 (+) Transcript_10412:39-1460(+)